MKRLEVFTSLYTVFLSSLILVTVLFTDKVYYNSLWFAICYSTLLVSGCYFAYSSTKKKFYIPLSVLVGQLFAAIYFELNKIATGDYSSPDVSPSTTFIWWALALVFAASLTVISNGKRATD